MHIFVHSLQGMLSLHLTHRHHFLAKIILVLADTTVPSLDRLVLAHHDVSGDFVQQPSFTTLVVITIEETMST
jgi:hypothetical protein